MKWVEVVVKTTRDQEDYVSHILYEAGAQGLAIEDPKDVIELSKNPDSWDFFDINLTDLDENSLEIKSYYSENDDLGGIIQYIRDNIEIYSPQNGAKLGQVFLNQVDENDWAESWKKYYKPSKIGKNVLIVPTWENYEAESNDIVIDMDPGMAFGTGTHETTILCIEALESFIRKDSRVYDIGCGSGILGIVAAKLGAAEVIGVDLDPTSIKVSRENIKRNGVEDRVAVLLGNLLDVIDEKADIIVSNIIAEVVAEMTNDIPAFLNDKGIFITSGIIIDKIHLVEDALLNNGFKILEIKKMNEWASIIAMKN